MSNNANVAAAIKEVAHKVFGGYAELLRMPHTARFSIGSVIACMPFPMVGMTITISVQHYYGNYCWPACSPPSVRSRWRSPARCSASWSTSSASGGCRFRRSGLDRRRHRPDHQHHQPRPGMGAVLPDAVPRRDSAVGRDEPRPLDDHAQGDRERTDRALSLSGVFDECMWIIGNPLASTLAVISGLLAFSFTGVCVVIGALMFLTELTTEPKSQTQLAREAGLTREEYRKREAAKAQKMRERDAADRARREAEARGDDEQTVQAAVDRAIADSRAGKKESIWGPGLIAVCVTGSVLARSSRRRTSRSSRSPPKRT